MMDNLLKTGDIAPDFTLPQDNGPPVTLSALRPNFVVLYFYPKDLTPGCTTEALDFTERLTDFKSLGAQVFGISKDSLKRHENFRAKHALQVGLLSDAQSTVCEAYGTWGEKQNYGRTYMGITRSTFLIDQSGEISKIWTKLRVKGHVEDVFDALEALVKS